MIVWEYRSAPIVQPVLVSWETCFNSSSDAFFFIPIVWFAGSGLLLCRIVIRAKEYPLKTRMMVRETGCFFLRKGAKWLSLRGRSTEQLATGFRWKEREYEGNQKLLHHCSYRSR